MKKAILLLISILSVIPGCKNSQPVHDEDEGFITVDVTAKYPQKELVLQDFMDVEYIPLETNNDFICQDLVLDIGKDMVIVRNYTNDGNIFIFDRRNGKALKKINRQGNGAEEYTSMHQIVLDEANQELFVNDFMVRKIFVYDLNGNFKRSLKQNNDLNFYHVFNFDDEHLICNNDWEKDSPPFKLISKQDGSITQEIEIPFHEKIVTAVLMEDPENNMTYAMPIRTHYPIIPHFNSYMLVEQSSDTIYNYLPDYRMKPVIVRTPSIESMHPEVFLFPSILTERYYFMEAIKKEFDWDKYTGFPATDLMYDKQEKAIFEYTVYNNDYADKRPVNMKSSPVNNEIASYQSLEISRLMEDYEKGKLKGRLKEIAAELEEESNPVIMLIKYRK